MNEEINRILNSRICDSIAKTVSKNNEEIQELETMFQRRNQQVVEMQKKLLKEMEYFEHVLQRNQRIKKNLTAVSMSVRDLNRQYTDVRANTVASLDMMQDNLQQMVYEEVEKLAQIIIQSKQKQQPEYQRRERATQYQMEDDSQEEQADTIITKEIPRSAGKEHSISSRTGMHPSRSEYAFKMLAEQAYVTSIQEEVVRLQNELALRQQQLKAEKQKNETLVKMNNELRKEQLSKIFRRKESSINNTPVQNKNHNQSKNSEMDPVIPQPPSIPKVRHAHKISESHIEMVSRTSIIPTESNVDSLNKDTENQVYTQQTGGSHIKYSGVALSNTKLSMASSHLYNHTNNTNSASPLRPLDTNVSLSDFPRKKSVIMLASCPSQEIFNNFCFDFGSLLSREYKYEGKKLDGKKVGRGVALYQSGYIYEGTFVNDNREGRGTLTNKMGEEVYSGEWCSGLFNGKGRLYEFPHTGASARKYKNWKCYTGHFNKGVIEGYGSITLNNGEKFLCTFKDGNIVGEGVYYRQEQSVMLGEMRSGRFVKSEE